MREKVIFDTNMITNRDTKDFFGGREMLMRFANDADIVIPDVVIQEIKIQKRKKLASKKDGFLSNPFHKLFALDETRTKTFDIDKFLQDLLDSETIPFERINLKDNDVLPKIKELAIKGLPPFEEKEGTDKGIKDALIYFSILEYLKEIPNKYVFVCVKDERFILALEPHPNIHVIQNYDDFKTKSISQYFDDYFIEKVREEMREEITKKNILEYWHNIEENQNVLINHNNEEFILEVDNGEIIGFAKKDNFKNLIEDLINPVDIQQVRSTIENLSGFTNYLSDDEIISILESIWKSTHLFFTSKESELMEFFATLYLARGAMLEGETAKWYHDYFKPEA